MNRHTKIPCLVQGSVHIVDRALRAPALGAEEERPAADEAGADQDGEDAAATAEPQDDDAEIWGAARDRARAEGGERARTGKGGWQAARRAHGGRASLRLTSKRCVAHARVHGGACVRVAPDQESSLHEPPTRSGTCP